MFYSISRKKIIMNPTLWTLVIMITLCEILTVQALDEHGKSSVKHNRTPSFDEWLNYYDRNGEISTDHNRTPSSDGNTGISSNPPAEEKSCFGWITEFIFTEDSYQANKIIAEYLDSKIPDVLDTMNIWPRGYAKALLDSDRTHCITPFPFCSFFYQTTEIAYPNITPEGDYKTCADWIYISGYDSFLVDYNFKLAVDLIDERLHNVLSDCALGYARYLTQKTKKDPVRENSEGGSYFSNSPWEINLYVNLKNPIDFCYDVLHIHPYTEVSFKNCFVTSNTKK